MGHTCTATDANIMHSELKLHREVRGEVGSVHCSQHLPISLIMLGSQGKSYGASITHDHSLGEHQSLGHCIWLRGYKFC